MVALETASLSRKTPLRASLSIQYYLCAKPAGNGALLSLAFSTSRLLSTSHCVTLFFNFGRSWYWAKIMRSICWHTDQACSSHAVLKRNIWGTLCINFSGQGNRWILLDICFTLSWPVGIPQSWRHAFSWLSLASPYGPWPTLKEEGGLSLYVLSSPLNIFDTQVKSHLYGAVNRNCMKKSFLLRGSGRHSLVLCWYLQHVYQFDFPEENMSRNSTECLSGKLYKIYAKLKKFETQQYL